MRLLCNDVAPKRVIVDFVTGVWWIAGGLHLASDHNVPREQPHLCPHINPTVLLTKVVKPGSDYFMYTKNDMVLVSPQSTTDIAAGDVTPIHKNLLRIVDTIR